MLYACCRLVGEGVLYGCCGVGGRIWGAVGALRGDRTRGQTAQALRGDGTRGAVQGVLYRCGGVVA